MSFIKNIFKRKEAPVKSYQDFWNWFKKNEKAFFNVVKKEENIDEDFFEKISPKLDEIKEGYFYVTGMYDDNTVELILTADGNIKHIVFVEELVSAAPAIAGWKFTALKPALEIKNIAIEMSGYRFDKENIFFYSNDLPGYPDEIDVVLVHNDLDESNETQIVSGTYIFLDNLLGELDSITGIDNIKIVGKEAAEKELIPVVKLKDFLTWREKEFIEKYHGTRHNTESDSYSNFEAELKNGNMLLAIINTDLLDWDGKASHPWVAVFTIQYDGTATNGMPGDSDYQLMNKIEDDMMLQLKDTDGYLNIGRQTADGEREIYFACNDFRKPSKVFFAAQQAYSNNFTIEFDIYKDKYWQSFNRFNNC
ncbi:hypothetical protein BH11BAC5_BH11BAC5_26450 [soil metagenome]